MKAAKKIDLFEEAKRLTAADPDGTWNEDDLINTLAPMIDVDVDAERKRRAKEIVNSRTKPGGTRPRGQLTLPGLEKFAWEPERMVRDDNNRIVEEEKAPYDYKVAEAQRARGHAEAASDWADRKSEEVFLYGKWAAEQSRAGRPVLEVTWGNCVRELGFLTEERRDNAESETEE